MVPHGEVLERPAQLTVAPPVVNKADAQHAAEQYVTSYIDSSFTVASGERYYSKPLGCEIWSFVICCDDGPISGIKVDAQTGAVIPLTADEIRTGRERAVIAKAQRRGELPVDEHGYVLREYARRCANRYLGDEIGMFLNAVDPQFVAGAPPLWKVIVVFKRYALGPFTVGEMQINAQTGEPIKLTNNQIERMRANVCAFVGS